MDDQITQDCKNEPDGCAAPFLCDNESQCFGHKIGLLVINNVDKRKIDDAIICCRLLGNQTSKSSDERIQMNAI